MKSAGSWTIVCDVAGRVTRSDAGNQFVTVAAVAIPREVRDQVRGRLVRAFAGAPAKWSAAGLPGLTRAVAVVSRYPLSVLIRKVHRAEAWAKFWQDGDDFGKRMEALVGERTRYLGSDAILKTILFIGAFGAMTGVLLAMKRVRVPDVAPSPERRIGVEFAMINDMDIEDAETRRLFASYVEEWPNVTGFMAELGIEPRVVVSFEREQDEPLLLLPDYLAGAFYHADARANLSKPVAPPEGVRAVMDDFSRRHGWLLMIQDGDFAEPYPLYFDGGSMGRRPR